MEAAAEALCDGGDGDEAAVWHLGEGQEGLVVEPDDVLEGVRQPPVFGEAFAGDVVIEAADGLGDVRDVAAFAFGEFDASGEGFGEDVVEGELAEVVKQAAEEGFVGLDFECFDDAGGGIEISEGAAVAFGDDLGGAGDAEGVAPEGFVVDAVGGGFGVGVRSVGGAVRVRFPGAASSLTAGVGVGVEEAVDLDGEHCRADGVEAEQDDGAFDGGDVVGGDALGAFAHFEDAGGERRVGLDEGGDLADVGVGLRGESQDLDGDGAERRERFDMGEDEFDAFGLGRGGGGVLRAGAGFPAAGCRTDRARAVVHRFARSTLCGICRGAVDRVQRTPSSSSIFSISEVTPKGFFMNPSPPASSNCSTSEGLTTPETKRTRVSVSDSFSLIRRQTMLPLTSGSM